MTSMTRRWSPVEIETLLRVFYYASYYEQAPHTPATEAAIKTLLNCRLIDRKPMNDKDYFATERGRTLVDMLCETPLPVEQKKWIDPRLE